LDRLFYAVWPDAAGARALAALAVRVAEATGGRPVREDQIHLTLAFLGEVDDSRRRAVLDAAKFRARPFELVIDRTGAFRRAGVAWAGPSESPKELLDLQARIQSRLRERGFALDERPFAPHVTLARRTLRLAGAVVIEPVAWRASEFTLVRSETGTGRYSIEERWKLER
jgi:RNA 2',3'-cyclic 3'-phosphodiesterase